MSLTDAWSQLDGRRPLLAACLVLMLGACAHQPIPPPSQWRVMPLADAAVVPPNGGDPTRRTRVVVLPSDDSPSARGAGLAAVASAALESALAGDGSGVEIVDRKLADRLDKELKLAEIKGTGSYGGPEVADYAIRIVMGTASWSSTYTAASSFKNPLTGKMVDTPAGYTHKASSAMTARIYTVPALKLVTQFPLDGSTTNATQPRPAVGTDGVALLREATISGVNSKTPELLNPFQPKGYITERRTLEKKSILRVQLGRNTGAKAGDTVEIFDLQKTGDSLDEYPVGSGVMSDLVGESGSWILVEDEKVANAIRKWDYVKVKARRCGLKDLEKCVTSVLK